MIVERDPVGAQPVYYASWMGRTLVSSSLTEMVRSYPGALTFNLAYLQSLAWGFFGLTEETPFHEISRLPPGCRLQINPAGRPVVQRHFPLTIPDWDGIDPIAGFRHRLSESLRRVHGSGELVGVLLSGGLDSAAVGLGLAPQIRSYSLDYPSPPARDREALDSVLKVGQWPKVIYPVEDTSSREFGLESGDGVLSFYSPNMFLLRPLLRMAAMDKVQVMCTGLGGDDIYSLPPLTVAAYLREGHFRQVLKHWRKPTFNQWLTPFLPTSLYERLNRRRRFARPLFRLDKSELFHLKARICTHFEEVHDLHPVAHLRNRLATAFYSGQLSFCMEQEQEMARTFGMRFAYPLLDPDLIRYFLSIPLDQLPSPFDDKAILRAAVEGQVPDFIRERRSTQDCTLVAEEILKKQREVIGQRLEALRREGWIEPVRLESLSVDEVLTLIYGFNILQTARGVYERKEAEKQKAL